MGASKSKLSKKEINDLTEKTSFTEEEIKLWFAGFQRDCPTGKLSKSEGNVEEKLEWAFQLYDLDNSGTITKEEMLEIVEAIFSLLGSDERFAQNSLSPESRVDRIFSKMDINGDGELSKEEFLRGAKNDKSICQALSLYDKIA
ncbi:Oidioi.mRNA.OKI2018_I69.chr2.g4127.t1.cds [Oikopleura dioica]|uniref:Oidioi.mRNA.OKI2018_I69.chr2.g4127.t1.cds n=1 Tax=Oikopleura dioica TaxID=34765 RepID=A0ABN7T5F0_OIKDI|nr:Oidioi.mRNA.OKI2018_I69.chr2.g4127.t1.cds [Oikopleura dioica]